MTLDPLSLDRLGEQRSWAYRIARQLVRRDEEAEEIVQRAWITAWRRPPSGERGWRPWMRTVILNLVRERSRRDETRRRHERAALPPALDPVDPTCEDAEQREVRERLAVRVGRLPEPYRTVLRLRYYDELTSPEIGARLGVPAGTVRWRLKVALDLLREDLDREAGGDRSRWLSAVLAAWPALRSDVGRGAGALPGSARSGGPLLPLAVGASLAVVLGLGLSMVAQRAPRATGEVAAAVTRARGDRELPVLAPGRAEPRTPVATGAASPDPGSAGLLVEVVDPAGTLLADARVEVFDGSTFRERGRTAADGRGRVTLLPGDLGAAHTGARVAIRARAEGQAVSEVLHVPAPHARTEPGSPGKTGGETGVVRLVTSGPARRLTGVVLAPDGRPVAGAQVAWVERRQQMRAGGTELRGPCAGRHVHPRAPAARRRRPVLLLPRLDGRAPERAGTRPRGASPRTRSPRPRPCAPPRWSARGRC
jgi:RNA polymerase sigma factor (sigma-70 family)